jgi:anti-anti-sigma factor
LDAQPKAAAPDPGVNPSNAESWPGMTIDQGQMTLSITRPSDSSVDYVQIVGDVDLADANRLESAARRLVEADASVIYVDLAGVTFIGSTLVGFLVGIGNSKGPTRRQVVLCRPTPMASKVIHLTGLDELATVRPDLPDRWLESASG